MGRQPLRDQCLLRLIYRHGLRASEARDAKWTDFDIMAGSGPKTFHVRRLKGSVDSVHTLDRDEVSALRRLKADSTSPFVFVSERGGPLSPDMIARIVERAAEAAKPWRVSKVAHGACPAPPPHDPPDTPVGPTCSCPAEPAKELSGRSARSLGASRPPKVRPAPGGSLCGKLLLKRGPVSKFFLYLLIRFQKLGEGIPRLVVLVGSARQPGTRPPKSPTRIGPWSRRWLVKLACWPMARSHPPYSQVSALKSLDNRA